MLKGQVASRFQARAPPISFLTIEGRAAANPPLRDKTALLKKKKKKKNQKKKKKKIGSFSYGYQLGLGE